MSATGELVTSTWFAWHAGIFGPGTSVLDIGCGLGRHAMAAAKRGAEVVGIDSDADRLGRAEKAAESMGVAVNWVHTDLEKDPLPSGQFDVVMMFYYLDRGRMPDFLAAVKPGGHFLAETFLREQRELGTGPTCNDHLLEPGEWIQLVRPFEVTLEREVLEDFTGRPTIIASVLADNRSP